ncbi:uracil-DNA glycosylase [Thiomicrospira sp. WB1]|uniref:uracil-DNA glycosylase n=1 Tax=Thiomicrospira sp. WB1 TaxID=1685380 RepID=UPI00074828C9|nr:uracil-DNA glycosylase [Thiomicrospira sp. WB1]KUJ71954.1 uracil-DNA glycosylase [Thiomicrospira sp. WB1]
MSQTNDPRTPEPIDCFQCQHFYITWDEANPRGCKAFGFKTTQMPSAVVLESSGRPCLKFLPKKRTQKKKPKRGWIA